MLGDRQRIEGSGNTVAGRDITVVVTDRDSLRAQFRDRLNQIDVAVNALLPPGGLLSPTAENKQQRFSSEELILSLTRVGIPIQVGLEITENLPEFLPAVLSDTTQATTAHIRRAVLRTIYALSSQAPHAVSHWADEYARRYGNPDERLKVLFRDGSEADLSFSFLLDTLVPHLIENVLEVDRQKIIQSELISKALQRRMAEEILDHVRGLNVYAIRYKTLYNLAYDLAIQHPHPWFVDSRSRQATIEYDLARASSHVSQLEPLLALPEKGPVRHSLRVASNHTSSALLAHYGAFLGVTQGGSGPLAHLIQTLALSAKDGNPVLWEYSSIRQIEGDLIALSTSLDAFRNLLTRLRHNSAAADKLLPVAVREARQYIELATLLIRPPRNPAVILSAPPTDSSHTSEEIERSMVDALIRVPVLQQVSRAPSGRIRFLHQVPAPLGALIKPCLMVCLVTSEANPLRSPIVRARLDELAVEIGDDPLCNAAVLISHSGFAEDASVVLRERSTGGVLYFGLCSADLLDILAAPDRTRAFLHKLVSR